MAPKRRNHGDGEERERRKKTSTPLSVPDRNHRVDDMFKAFNLKKVVATTSGSNTSAGASVGESSVRSEELAGTEQQPCGSNTSAGASVGESSVRSEELAGTEQQPCGSNTSAGASVGESSVRSEELAGTEQQPCGSNTSAGASVGESSVRSEELAGTLLTSATTPQQPLLPKMDASEMKKEETDQRIKEEKGHSHSFAYSIVGKESQREITCSTPQTILEALLTSSAFLYEDNAKMVKDEELKEVKDKELKKVINKELVILRDNKAISSHFPCWLIGKQYPLTILYIVKGNSEPRKSVVWPPQRKAVIFHLKTEGGQKIMCKILNNINLKAKADEVSVYAFQGETVEFALERDGRIRSDVFSTCALKNVSNGRITEMTNPVNNLGGKTFKVIRDEKYASLKRRSKPEPVPCASTSTNSSTSSAQPSSTHVVNVLVSVNTDKAEQTAKRNTPTLAKPFPIPDRAILDLLRSQFEGLFKHMKGRKEGNFKLTTAEKKTLLVEYGKNDESCNTVKMQRELMVRANSVCQVRVGATTGSGFLLFDKFILTNAHVINYFYNGHTKQLTQKVTVSFCFEDVHVQSPVDSVPVKPEVVVFNYNQNDTGCYYDWALLELDSGLANNIPCGLLEHFATPPKSRGGICIIGHPAGGVKKTDTCHTIPGVESETVARDRYNAVQHLVTKKYFTPSDEKRLKNEHTISYDTRFYYGSSGSPVFNEFCNVVAMHTWGYCYDTNPPKEQIQSFIEYAQSLSFILPILILNIVERERFDVLKAYFQYTSDHPERKVTWDQLKEEVVKIENVQNYPTIVQEFLERYDRHNQSQEGQNPLLVDSALPHQSEDMETDALL